MRLCFALPIIAAAFTCSSIRGNTAIIEGTSSNLTTTVSSTMVILCGAKEPKIVTAVLTYSDGTAVRYDDKNMHGLTPPEIYELALSVKDHGTYMIGCHRD